MSREATLARSALFDGVPESEVAPLAAGMRAREFEAGDQLCAAGDPSDTIWLITAGLVNWQAATSKGAEETGLRMRKGEVIGAQDAILGAQRTATVTASTPVSTLEFGAEELVELTQRFPQILLNVIKTQRERLFRTSEHVATAERGEEVALVPGPSLAPTVGTIVAAARSASVRPVSYLDRGLSFAGALAADDDAARHATVLIPGQLEPEMLHLLLEQVDRVVALVGNAEEAGKLAEILGSDTHTLEVVLVGDEAASAWTARNWSSGNAPGRAATSPSATTTWPGWRVI